jgi:hypothetical protein
MHIKAAGLTALLVLSWSPVATAGPVVDAATRAEALQAEGKTVEALDALDAAADAIWTSGPLAFRKVAIVDSAAGFGNYEEKTDPTFRPDEKMTVYVEPVGFGYGTGDSVISLTADLALENATGQVLGQSENVFSLATAGAPGTREFHVALTFEVPFLRPGDYKAVFTVHDQNSEKSGSFEVPFTIALPVAQ